MIAYCLLFLLSFLYKVKGQAECTTACPNGWTTFEESCYYFGHGPGMSFTESEHYCRQHNGHLVHVNDATENAFLREHLSRLKTNHYWMGLTDEEIEGIFKWSDDDTRPEFTDWTPGEPTDGGHHEDCAIFWSDRGYHWNDVKCDFHGVYQLCERPAFSPQPGIIG